MDVDPVEALEEQSRGKQTALLVLATILLAPTLYFLVTLFMILLGTLGFGESCDPACTAP